MTAYVVATVKPWNLAAFARRAPALPGDWHLLDGPEKLTPETLGRIAPRYVFFPHWSWRVPASVLDAYECVCFHMADVPYGRGGSPLQNLIVRGHADTKLSALRMVEELDAGPVYIKRPLSLAGSAGEIFTRMADLSFDMMAEIAAHEPAPVPQSGEPVVFERRKPEQSRLPEDATPEALFDFVRMLDADTYPRAFLDHGNLRLEFAEARLTGGALEARVRIVPKGARR
jgi:methionyl-tRNA formyltransferase